MKIKMIKYNVLINELKQNKVIAIPTDTIYGFSVLPNEVAIKNLINLKNRDKNKGLILLTSKFEYLTKYIDNSNLELLKKSYKNITKPTTFITPSTHKLAINNTLAIRKTNDKFIDYFCTKLKSPIISTSANISGKLPIKNVLELKKYFADKIKYYPAQNTNNNSSQIIHLITKKIYR